MAEAKYIISAEDRTKSGVDSAKRNLNSLTNSTETASGGLASMAGTAAIAATAVVAVGKVALEAGKAAFQAFTEFAEGERKVRQLSIALNDNAGAVSKATKVIDDMASVSLASKDEIEDLVTELALLGKSTSDIDRITRASVALSNVTGQDLKSAFTQINSTFDGSVGKLGKLIPEINTLTEAQLEAGGAVDVINSKFSKFLDEGDPLQKIKNLKDAWADFKESLGSTTEGFFAPILLALTNFLNEAKKRIDDMPKKIQAAPTTSNITTRVETQKKIVDEAQKNFQNQVQRMLKEGALSWYPNFMDIKPGSKPNMEGLSTGKTIVLQDYVDALNIFTSTMRQYDSLLKEQSSSPATPKPATPTPTPTTPTTPKPAPAPKKADTPQTWQDVAKSIIGSAPVTTGSKPYYADWMASQEKVLTNKTKTDGEVPALTEYIKNLDAALDKLLESGMYELSERWPSELKSKIDASMATLKVKSPEVYKQVDYAIRDVPTALQKEPEKKESSLFFGVDYAEAETELVRTVNVITTELEASTKEISEEARAIVQLIQDSYYSGSISGLQTGKGVLADDTGASFEAFEQYQAMFASQPKQESWKDIVTAIVGKLPTGTGKNDPFFAEWMNLQKLILKQNTLRIGGEAALQEYIGKLDSTLSTLINSGKFSMDDEWPKLLASIINDSQNEKEKERQKQSDIDIFGGGNSLQNFFKETFIGGSIGSDSGSARAASALTPLADALGPIMDIMLGMDPVLAILLPILESAAEFLAPVVSSVLEPLMGILTILGQTIGQMLVPILEGLGIVFEWIGKAFVWLYNNAIRHLGNAFIWLGVALYNAFAWISNLFGAGMAYKKAEDSYLKEIDYAGLRAAGASSESSSYASSSSASYKSMTVTQNFNFNAPIVGEGGFRELAIEIRKQFELLSYYGT